MEKQYTNGEITVTWKPETCIHSAICFHGLIDVFNPKRRPWVNMDGASTERIIEQISRCPSGALSYQHNAPQQSAQTEQESLTVRVETLPNGPLLVYGTLHVKDGAGNEVVRANTTAFCRCGASSTKPFCDGSHVTAKFQG